MKYKGYTGYVEYDDEAKIFHGEVLGIKDVVTFQGLTVDEIEHAFKGSVNDCLNFCKVKVKINEKDLMINAEMMRRGDAELGFRPDILTFSIFAFIFLK